MSFILRMVLNGKEYNVLNCHYSFVQETDATGRPSSVARGGRITVTVESTGDTTFFELMCNSFETKDGSLKFIKRESDSTLKELKFKEAYLVEYTENFDSTGSNPVTETMTWSAREVDMGTATFKNNWVQS